MSFELTITELANDTCEEIELTAGERLELCELGNAAGMPEDAAEEFERWLDQKETPVTEAELDRLYCEEMERRDAEKAAEAARRDVEKSATFRQIQPCGKGFKASVKHRGVTYRIPGKFKTEAAAWTAASEKMIELFRRDAE